MISCLSWYTGCGFLPHFSDIKMKYSSTTLLMKFFARHKIGVFICKYKENVDKKLYSLLIHLLSLLFFWVLFLFFSFFRCTWMTSSIYTEIRKMAVKMLHQAVGILTGSVLQFDNLERKNKKEIVFNIRIPFFEIITNKKCH